MCLKNKSSYNNNNMNFRQIARCMSTYQRFGELRKVVDNNSKLNYRISYYSAEKKAEADTSFVPETGQIEWIHTQTRDWYSFYLKEEILCDIARTIACECANKTIWKEGRSVDDAIYLKSGFIWRDGIWLQDAKKLVAMKEFGSKPILFIHRL